MIATFEKGKCKFDGDDAVKFGYVKGEAVWAHVLGINQFGNYSIDVKGDAVVELEEELLELRDSAYDAVIKADPKKKPIKVDVLKQDDDGNKFIQFKLPELNWKGEENKVKIYDASGKEVTDDWDELIGNGSIVKVKYMAKPYYMSSTKAVGISYRFYAVQIIKLEEYSGGGDSGFGDETSDTGAIENDGGDY